MSIRCKLGFHDYEEVLKYKGTITRSFMYKGEIKTLDIDGIAIVEKCKMCGKEIGWFKSVNRCSPLDADIIRMNQVC